MAPTKQRWNAVKQKCEMCERIKATCSECRFEEERLAEIARWNISDASWAVTAEARTRRFYRVRHGRARN